MALLKPFNYTLRQRWGPSHLGVEPPMYAYLGRAWWNPIAGQPWFKFYRDFHPGLDLAAPEGTPILASEAGTVTAIGQNGVSGLRIHVTIRPGVRYVHGHLSGYGPGLKLGSKVQRGQVIGYVGHSGWGVTGNHSHFGVLIEKPYNKIGFIYDPSLFFVGGANANDPRIKPL